MLWTEAIKPPQEKIITQIPSLALTVREMTLQLLRVVMEPQRKATLLSLMSTKAMLNSEVNMETVGTTTMMAKVEEPFASNTMAKDRNLNHNI